MLDKMLIKCGGSNAIYYGATKRHFEIRYFKNLGVSYLTGKKVANTLHHFKIFLFDHIK